MNAERHTIHARRSHWPLSRWRWVFRCSCGMLSGRTSDWDPVEQMARIHHADLVVG